MSIEQGLSQSSVNCILQDRLGFLWIGTQSGLNRFDGYQLEIYRQSNGDLTNDWIAALLEDDKGSLWIGTEGGGLTVWSNGKTEVSHFRHDPENPASLSSDRIRTLTLDSSGNLWIGTVESGLNRLSLGESEILRFQHGPNGLSDDNIRAVIEDRHGKILVGSIGGIDEIDPESGGVRPISLDANPNSPTLSESNGQVEVQALLEDSKGFLWVGAQQGLLRFHPDRSEAQWFSQSPDRESLNHNWVRSLFEDREGRLWVGTDGGLNLWNRDNRQFSSFLPGAPPNSDQATVQVLDIAEDRSGNLWFGTFREGAQKWNPRSLSFQRYQGSLDNDSSVSNNVFAIALDDENGLWTGSFGGGLSRFDRSTLERETFLNDPSNPSSIQGNRVTALLYDQSNTLWVGTFASGLSRFDMQTKSFSHFRHQPEVASSISSNGITALHQDPEGRLWIGTYGGGLNLMTDQETFAHYRHDEADPQSLSNDRVLALEDAPGGRLWLATDGGLNLFDTQDGTSRSWDQTNSPLSSGELFSIYADPNGVVWIGTKGNGFDRLELGPTEDELIVRNYSQAEGLPDPTVWGIRSDASGRLWLSTNNGLVRFDPQTGEMHRYDTSHGLQSTEFNLGAHFRSTNGELFFGGVNGVNSFFPDQVQANLTPPPIVLTYLTLLNQPMDIEGPLESLQDLELHYDDHFFTFEFAALDFTAPERNQYRYQLKGFEDRWVELDNQRLISFASLNPGRYTLNVQGSNSDGIWSDPGASIAITVTPPLWRTWWFRGLLLVFAALAAGIAHQLRIHRIRINNERLHTLVRMRTRDLEEAQERLVRKERLAVLGELSGSVAHELRNPLGIIKNSVFFLRLTQKMVDDKAKEHLALIEREIQRSDRIIGELLDYAKEPTAQTEDATVRSIVEATLETIEVPESVDLRLELGDEDEADPLRVKVDPGQIERVMNNLLSNAVQAMPEGGTLTVRAEPEGERAWIRVTDTGVGIEKEDQEKIFEPLFTRKIYGIGLGLPLSVRYVQMNSGELRCESSVGEGTTFHLYLPLAKPAES